MVQLTTLSNARILIVGDGNLVDEILRNLEAYGRQETYFD
jgi:hypothetical protein